MGAPGDPKNGRSWRLVIFGAAGKSGRIVCPIPLAFPAVNGFETSKNALKFSNSSLIVRNHGIESRIYRIPDILD